MQTEVLKISPRSIAVAVELMRKGEIVGIPTETVYGLGAIATDPVAVKKIYEVKGRPADNPLIAHVHKDYDLSKLVYVDKPYVYDLMKKFTPGPLTMVFRSKGVVCKEATCGGDTLAVRIPSHKGCAEFLRALNAPMVAPSANLSKHTSPVTAAHVYDDLNGKIPLILDGGKCTGGIESTVLDVTEDVPRILRAGLITKEMVESVCGACEIAKHLAGDKVRSPGVKYGHYKPRCETALFTESELKAAEKFYNEESKKGKKVYYLCDDAAAEKLEGNKLLLGDTPEKIAASLYDKLLEGEKKADLIIGILPERTDGVYLGIVNRMGKACGGK